MGARSSGGPPQSRSCQATKELCGCIQKCWQQLCQTHDGRVAQSQRQACCRRRSSLAACCEASAQLPLPAVFKGLIPGAFSAAHPGCHTSCSVPVEMRADIRINVYGVRAVCVGVLCATVILDSVGRPSIWLCCRLSERSSALCLGTRGCCPLCLGGARGGRLEGSFEVAVLPAPC